MSSMDTSIPYLRKETLMAAVEVVDERESQSAIMQLFPRRLKSGDRITVRTLQRRPQDVRQTSRDGKGYTVGEGTMTEKTYEPGWIKPNVAVTGADLDVFYAAQQAAGQMDGRSQAIVDDADQRIMAIADRLASDAAAWRKKACVGALIGSYVHTVDDVSVTASYGLTAIASPSTTWTNAAATILSDFRTALSTFYAVNGVECDTVFYNRLTANDFAINTEIKALFAGSEAYTRAALEMGINSSNGGPLGLNVGLGAGIQWIPVEGLVAPIGGGSATDIWPRTTLVLGNRARMGAEWAMSYSAQYGITQAGPNIEIKRPTEGDDVKVQKVTLFDNGIATFLRPDCVMPYVVEF